MRARQVGVELARGTPGSSTSATWRKLRSTCLAQVGEAQISSTSTVTVPDSIFDRSRMSLISVSRSVPEEWMFRANSTCLAVRLPSAFSASCWPRMRIELSGVRSSCDMLARNSDLYLEVSASCSAFSSRALAGLLDFVVLALDLGVLLGELAGPWCASSSLVCCSSFCWVCSSTVSCCDCLSRPSVRIVASIVLSTMPMLWVSWSRKVEVASA